MKSLKFFLSGFVIFVFSLESSAQFERPNVLPSPNASAANRFSNVQVGYYTGIPNISIPLGVLPGKDISIPVSLDYHAAGIKVQDVAGSCGLGWVLNAGGGYGGSISRVVRGLPDGIKSYCAEGPGSYFWNIHEDCDGERDIFYFSMMGRSGKMFLDGQGQAYTMPYMDIKVSPGVGANNGYWMITDENGYQYFFGETANDRETTTYYTGNGSVYTEKYTYTSTWYLNKVISPKGEQVATFSYSQGNNFEYEMFQQQGFRPSGSTLSAVNRNTKIRINQPKYLSAINTSIASVQFGYLDNREDLPNAWQLNSIRFEDINGVVKQNFYLVLDYFVGEYGTPNARLRLSAVRAGSNGFYPAYSFKYIGGDHNPSRQNHEFDHFGYYNTSLNRCQPATMLPVGCIEGGVSKEVSLFGENQVFALSEINYASGAKTTFQYESVSRGIRVKSITKFDGSSVVAKSTFAYSNGEGVSSPAYAYTAHNGTVIYSSSSYKEMFDLNGTNVGYSEVTETFLDGSKIIREFTNFSDAGCNDGPPVVAKYHAEPTGSTPVYVSASNVNGPPFSPATTQFWKRGLPKRIRIYDAQNNLLSKDTLIYQDGALLSSIPNTVLHNYEQAGGSNPWITYISGVYHVVSRPIQLKQQKSYRYDQANTTKSTVTTTNYTYHNIHRTVPATIETQIGSEPFEKTVYRYPIDLTGTTNSEPTSPTELAAGVWKLVAWNVITPVEQLNYRFDKQSGSYKLTGSSLYTYRRNQLTNRPMLKGILSLGRSDVNAGFVQASLTNNYTELTYDNNYRIIESYTYNDATGNVLNITDNQGVTRNFEFGYNNSLITASYSTLGTTQFKTQYSYNTVDGLLTETDVNNQAINYEYDNFGRLKLVRDNSGDIVTRYRYNTRNINEFNAVVLPTRSSAPVNFPIVFTSRENGESSGVTRYIWDFGDGQVIEGSATFVTHAYSTPGTYTIKLAKLNPEYGKVIVSKQIVIY